MIGMMYLVLTALLAMNISKEVLNGFVKVENGLHKTDLTIQGKARETMLDFEAKYLQDQQKVKPYYDAAKDVTAKADALHDHITQLKGRILAVASGERAVVEAGGDLSKYIARNGMTQKDTVLSIQYLEKKDEYTEITGYLVGPDAGTPKTGEYTASDLREKLEAFRDELKAVSFTDFVGNDFEVPQGLKSSLDQTFVYPKEMEDGKEVLWEAANFYDVPVAAVIPILSKLQVDVENAKANMLTELIAGIEGKSFKFTNLMPLVVPESNYILRGDSFRADVLMAAFDATISPDMYVDDRPFDGRDSTMLAYEGRDALTIEGGLGKLRISTKGMPLGDKNYKGLIRYQNPDGSMGDYPFYTPSFSVAEPALVVSPTKMNVFYRGVPNPVEVSVPGVNSDDLEVRITGGHRIKPDGDNFIVEPGEGKEATITVTATLPDGSKKTLPGRDFRVKRIPNPEPSYGGLSPTDNAIRTNVLKNTPGLACELKGFDFDVKTRVKSFEVLIAKGGSATILTSSTANLTAEMKTVFDGLRSGAIVIFQDILVDMPDGTTRVLSPMNFKVI